MPVRYADPRRSAATRSPIPPPRRARRCSNRLGRAAAQNLQSKKASPSGRPLHLISLYPRCVFCPHAFFLATLLPCLDFLCLGFLACFVHPPRPASAGPDRSSAFSDHRRPAPFEIYRRPAALAGRQAGAFHGCRCDGGWGQGACVGGCNKRLGQGEPADVFAARR